MVSSGSRSCDSPGPVKGDVNGDICGRQRLHWRWRLRFSQGSQPPGSQEQEPVKPPIYTVLLLRVYRRGGRGSSHGGGTDGEFIAAALVRDSGKFYGTAPWRCEQRWDGLQPVCRSGPVCGDTADLRQGGSGYQDSTVPIPHYASADSFM
jgi:hypothetical protein